MTLTPTKLLRLAALVAALAFLPGRAAAQAGYWRTSGNKILDASGTPVRIAGINWYGFETANEVPHGLWTREYRAVLDQIKSMGFNTVRIPFSNQMIRSTTIPSVSFWSNGPINTDLQGLTPIQVMDRIIAYCGQIGLKVMLDNHRSENGNSAQANGLWYTSAYPESQWIADWQLVTTRYLGNTTVVAMDLRNEPHLMVSGGASGACWGCGGATDWRLAAERAGNAVLAINPDLLIVVEGNDSFGGSGTWWGGQLAGARDYPVRLSVANRLVYSPHDYGPTEFQQSWFNASTTQASLEAVWERNWGYIDSQGIAPVLVGEFGTPNAAADVTSTAPGSQGQWFTALVEFMRKRPTIHWTYWALNGNDRYGLYDGTFAAVALPQKLTLLQTIQAPFGGGGPTTYTLTVTRTGSGTVTGGTISCGTTCSATYASGTAVTLTATPAAGATFTGWSGACTGTGSCTVTMTANRSVGAAFQTGTGTTYALTVTKAGTGTGVVTSSPAGVSCGATCAASFASGTTVTLSAAIASNSTFAGWSGACTGTATTCTVSMTAARAVTATFTSLPTYTLGVTKAGTGSGTVTSSTGGISCGTACSASFGGNAVVTLTATPAAGSTFVGWSGACTGAAATCTLTMSAARAVTATFDTSGGDPTAPCANPVTFTSNTGNFNTAGAVCYRTATRVNGWGCSNFAGRTVSVNGGTATATCGAGPFPLAQVGGYTYFSVSAGSYPWASIYLW